MARSVLVSAYGRVIRALKLLLLHPLIVLNIITSRLSTSTRIIMSPLPKLLDDDDSDDASITSSETDIETDT